MDIAKENCEDLLDSIGVRTHKRGRKYIGACPVHGGDSQDSFIFFPDGREGKSFWLCLSNHCERSFGGNIVGLVQGVLSHEQNDWNGADDEKLKIPKQVAIDHLCKLLNITWEGIKADISLAQRNQFVAAVEALTAKDNISSGNIICSRSKLRSFIQIPATYYMDRGYSRDILDRFDVGLCLNSRSELYGRVVVPIYTDDHKDVLGCIGRSTNPECLDCGKYHNPDEPCDLPRRAVESCKWRCTEGFNDKNFLYNYWDAGDHIINNNRTVIIVEGCGDVWRTVEAGIENVVALNGSDLTEPQQIQLECSGATHILCLTDDDEAGDRAYDNMIKRCRFSKITRVRPDGVKDVGELNPNDPFFQKLKDICKNKRS